MPKLTITITIKVDVDLGNDEEVIEINREALKNLSLQEKELVIVPGATHLFEVH